MAKTDRDILSDDELERFFRAARAETPEPGEALLARIMADAETEHAARAPAMARAGRSRRPGLWAAVVGAIGGWPALASMATAAVAGVWLGFASPDEINTLVGGLLLTDTETTATAYEFEDLLPGYGGFEGLDVEAN